MKSGIALPVGKQGIIVTLEGTGDIKRAGKEALMVLSEVSSRSGSCIRCIINCLTEIDCFRCTRDITSAGGAGADDDLLARQSDVH